MTSPRAPTRRSAGRRRRNGMMSPHSSVLSVGKLKWNMSVITEAASSRGACQQKHTEQEGVRMNDLQPLRSIEVPRPIPVVLSFVAGYVDSCTYLALFGVFVAQVTGSFV